MGTIERIIVCIFATIGVMCLISNVVGCSNMGLYAGVEDIFHGATADQWDQELTGVLGIEGEESLSDEYGLLIKWRAEHRSNVRKHDSPGQQSGAVFIKKSF